MTNDEYIIGRTRQLAVKTNEFDNILRDIKEMHHRINKSKEMNETLYVDLQHGNNKRLALMGFDKKEFLTILLEHWKKEQEEKLQRIRKEVKHCLTDIQNVIEQQEKEMNQ